MKPLQKRLKLTARGHYFKAYKDARGNLLRTPLELAVAKLLEFAGLEYEHRKKIRVGKTSVEVDFVTRRGFIEVLEGQSASADEVAKIRQLLVVFRNQEKLVIGRSSLQHSLDALGVPVISLAEEALNGLRSQSLFVDDPSLSFDYSHILPWSKKCSVLHGHTSTMLLEVVGRPVNGMIVDFGEVKRIVKDSVRELDHKLFIARRYVKEDRGSAWRIAFKGPNGAFDLVVPKTSTFLLEGEATVENLAEVIVRMISPRMPRNVDALGVYVYEGLNKGSHLLANLHSQPGPVR